MCRPAYVRHLYLRKNTLLTGLLREKSQNVYLCPLVKLHVEELASLDINVSTTLKNAYQTLKCAESSAFGF